MPTHPSRRVLLTLTLALAVVASACGSTSTSAESSTTVPATTEAVGGTLRVVTHDSFVVSDTVLAQFEAETGIKVEIVKTGDAGAEVSRAILTKDNPEGDVLYGIDNNLVSRAYDAGLFQPYASSGLASVDPKYQLDEDHRVTPVDHADVCLNYDVAWFAAKGIAPPQSFDDLVKPEYKGLLVTENAATSTPGLAFMLATVATYGEDGWQDYWRKLKANGVEVVDGWEQAYSTSFSGSSGKGDKPIVVSYATSPPAEVIGADPKPATAPTAVVPSTCFRQIEFAGVLAGARHVANAHAFIDFLLSRTFQEDMPLNMYVEPVNTEAMEPPEFARYATVPADPLSLPPDQISANREAWVTTWTQTVLG
ncbi:MAG TPA: thiamine ABC transporter substrate-binding protein [Acidimicrobiales bacterium]